MWTKTQLKDENLLSYSKDARDYALVNGVVLRFPSMENDSCVAHAPITLLPSPFPKTLYQECLDIQPTISNLMLGIANDHMFMEDVLHDIVKVDEFTRQLLTVNQKVQKEGLAQPIISCINRSDYMLDKYMTGAGEHSLRMRQVEVNAIASAMGPHSYNVSRMHKYLLSKYKLEPKSELAATVPENDSLGMIVQGLIDLFDAYATSDSYILMITEERSYNFSDHIIIELKLQERRPDIRIVRRRFLHLDELVKLGPNQELFLDSDSKEIAVVYFRYGYDPSNYNYETAWNTRLILERSRAIKCPSINFHLSGAKKFQQVLNSPEKLERFLSPCDAKKLSQLFCKFWSLDADTLKGQEGYQLGLNAPQNLVLKPQREGGGHNIFGEDIPRYLKNIKTTDERSQYILMEMINSPRVHNWLMLYDEDFNEKLHSSDQLVSELGIYGSIVANGSQVMKNLSAGYLVRSKKSGVMEGGVAAGHAAISSLILIDDTKIESKLLKVFD